MTERPSTSDETVTLYRSGVGLIHEVFARDHVRPLDPDALPPEPTTWLVREHAAERFAANLFNWWGHERRIDAFRAFYTTYPTTQAVTVETCRVNIGRPLDVQERRPVISPDDENGGYLSILAGLVLEGSIPEEAAPKGMNRALDPDEAALLRRLLECALNHEPYSPAEAYAAILAMAGTKAPFPEGLEERKVLYWALGFAKYGSLRIAQPFEGCSPVYWVPIPADTVTVIESTIARPPSRYSGGRVDTGTPTDTE